MRRLTLPILLLLSVFLILLSKWKVDASYQWRQPALTELVVTEHYTGDLGAIFLGARRLAADLAYIQFLQYYGSTPQGEEEEEGGEHEHHHHGDFGAGNYPRLKEFGTRIIRLDSFFNPPILEIAGALAFNIRDVEGGLALLADAMQRDPSFYRYRLYSAAILFKYNRKDKEMIGLLEQAIQFPDCPPIFQNVLGNLLQKYGEFEKAAKVYLHTSQTAHFDWERDTAQRKLEALLAEHPELLKVLGPRPS